jgi:hypothetical protein
VKFVNSACKITMYVCSCEELFFTVNICHVLLYREVFTAGDVMQRVRTFKQAVISRPTGERCCLKSVKCCVFVPNVYVVPTVNLSSFLHVNFQEICCIKQLDTCYKESN